MNTLKVKLTVYSLLILFVSCQSKKDLTENKFTVSGTIKGLDTEFMTRSYRDALGKRVSDSIFVNDGSFSYTTEIDEPSFIIFWPNVEKTIKRTENGYYPVKSSQFAFLASPGDEIEFKGVVTDFVDAYPTGTDANEDLASINRIIFPLMNASINILLKANKLAEEDPSKALLEDSIKVLDEKVIEHKKEFIASNPNSEAAVWYLSDMMMRSQISEEDAITVFNTIDSSLFDYPFYKDIAFRVEGIESTRIGNFMPNFVSNETLDSTEFDLNSLKGKYVLIDFWGTWCGPCIQEMPRVKEYQEKYSQDMIVLGINSGDSRDRMRDFVTSNDYNWQQVMNGSGDEDLVLRFNVTGFPTKIILDPEGKILYRFLGDTEEAFDVLDELLAVEE